MSLVNLLCVGLLHEAPSVCQRNQRTVPTSPMGVVLGGSVSKEYGLAAYIEESDSCFTQLNLAEHPRQSQSQLMAIFSSGLSLFPLARKLWWSADGVRRVQLDTTWQDVAALSLGSYYGERNAARLSTRPSTMLKKHWASD
ncbi:unnamed protein product [Pleuronectes platessa]|uniref:Uncharacterized protein n=1 Tax=Pleuronectes platessa TaxID=8262 RepID=A0A9N7UDK0_PLEPL|nr:unnamed protein product [Pleuronectes platessa]